MQQLRIIFALLGITISSALLAQSPVKHVTDSTSIERDTSSPRPQIIADNTTDKILRDKIMNEIQSGFDKKTKIIDSTVYQLDQKVNALNISIKDSKDAKEKVEKLFLRVQALEDRQKAMEQNDVNTYQANYQSAIVNLLSMDREIKPLLLFNSTRRFFDQLNEAGNPMNYAGYKEWFSKFGQYVKKNEKTDEALNMTSNLLTFSGSTAQYVPVVGPISSVLFAGMTTYLSSLGKRNKALRDQSEKMIALTMKVSQFDYDKGEIEHEWEVITAELKGLKSLYTHSLTYNLRLLNVDSTNFVDSFTTQSDAEIRYQYLTTLRKNASNYIAAKKISDPKGWKEDVYYNMMEVQSLKTRFGQITFRIDQNIIKYGEVFEKYKSDPQIGPQITNLLSKLTDLEETFDKAFDPMDYINSATKMYKVM
ncbi:hypothetical protein [Arachidicoccus sp.]|jgi:hypothetical protein|uniref:hypothetical protein n=1 Tax=Arachidicoccus sp. TaxID=1872624 RepID=UPI003D1D2428